MTNPPDDAFNDYEKVVREEVSDDERWKVEVRLFGCVRTEWWTVSIRLYEKKYYTRTTQRDVGFFGWRTECVEREKERWSRSGCDTTKNAAKSAKGAFDKAKTNIIEKMEDKIEVEDNRKQTRQKAKQAIASFDVSDIIETARRLPDN